MGAQRSTSGQGVLEEVQNQLTKVLLIDDDEDDYVLVRKLLSQSSHSESSLQWVSKFEDGLAEVKGGGHDICLLDYQLGNRNGLELLNQAMSHGIRTPIVFLTGSGDYELDLGAMRAGAADFLVKDQLSTSLLERSIRYALDRTRRREELLKAKRVIQSLSESNAAVIRIQDEFELLREICRIVVEVGGYRMAWVGYIEHKASRMVTPVAKYGYEEGYLEAAAISCRDTELDTNPTGISIRTRAPSVLRFAGEPTDSAPWKEEALKRGYASCMGLPICVEGRILGALTIYSSETHIFDMEEVELLVQLSGNLSHGIEALRRHQAQLHAKKLLKKANLELERRVQERTSDLVKLNSQLQEEVEERRLAEQGLRESEEHYRSLFDNMLNGFAYCRMLYKQGQPVDFTYLNVNKAFGVLTGLENVVGKRVSQVLPGIRESTPELFETCGKVALTGMPERFEIYVESLEMWCAISVYSPRREHFVALFDVVNERKSAEEALRKSLEEKVSLLKEVHHRVKNNLQIVASLLNLQARRARSHDVVDVLQDTRNRVHSMALLHEVLYRSGNLARINFATYVQELFRQLLRSFGPAAARISVENRVTPIGLPLEHSVPCGLIINELVSNALKHGFPNDRTGTIVVELNLFDGPHLLLRVSDNGVGLPPGLDPADTSTLGLRLVSNLARQLDGQLTVEKHAGGGAAFSVAFQFSENILS